MIDQKMTAAELRDGAKWLRGEYHHVSDLQGRSQRGIDVALPEALDRWADALDQLAAAEGTIATLRATNQRLNRRAQSAEAALDERSEDWNKRSTDKQRNHYYTRAKQAKARLAAVRKNLEGLLRRRVVDSSGREPSVPVCDERVAHFLREALALRDGPEGGQDEDAEGR